MKTSALPKRVYRFGLFEVDLDGGKLLRQGSPVKLQEQPLRVLGLLVEHPGQVVTREQLHQSLWPQGTYVEFDGSLNATLKRLRSALGDDADNPIFIETVPRQGYRFIAPVECEPTQEPNGSGATSLPDRPIAGEQPSLRVQTWWWPTLALVLVLLGVIAWRYPRRSQGSPQESRKVIAVLPFTNEGAGPDFDYLRFAIPNDLVSDLTSARAVTVRPFASTARFGSQPVDPATVGAELRVTYVLAGGFLLDHKNLHVNMELVEVAQNQSVWRGEVVVPPQQLIALQDQLAARAAEGLLPAIHISGASSRTMPSSRNERAVDLFLHSLTIPLDPEPNQLAIKRLEESVSLDSSYAPAWGELGSRYYIAYHYGNGGEAAVTKALEAYRRQSELDPDWPVVSTYIRAEQGDLSGAYDQAAEFLRRRPDAAMGHHSMSYVLRSAGLLDEADRQCQAALALDPGFNGFRSCAFSSILKADYAGAQIYIRLDEHSGFGAMLRMVIALRTGNKPAALAESNAVSQGGFQFAELARIYLNHAPEAELRKAAAALEVEPRSARDPETLYVNAAVLSFSGQAGAALRQLRKAIQGNYCSYPAMDLDPLFDPIRQLPEFAALHQAARQCQQNFLAHRTQVETRH